MAYMESVVSSLWRRWNVLVALALVGLALVPGVERQGIDLAELPERAPDALGWGLLVLQGAGVAVLRRWPAVCLTVVGASFGAHQLLGYPTTFAALGLLVAVTWAGALAVSHRWAMAGGAAAGYVVLAVALAWRGSPTELPDYIVFGVLLAGLWVAGARIRIRTQAQEQRRLDAERTAVHEERSRIARELHDVVTHHVTAMVVQADAGHYGTDASEGTTRVLNTISGTGRAALTDLRRLLGALEGTADEPEKSLAVTNLDDLVAGARAAGLQITFLREGTPRPVDAGPSLAVTRVVQESLTNAMKHAPGAATQVHVRYEGKAICLTITTSARTRPGLGRGGGHGLIGLRERVALAGGTFDAGPVDNGFTVCARIPA